MSFAPRLRIGLLLSATALLRVDGTISFAFGMLTAVFQKDVFSTAVDLTSAGVTGSGDSLMESALLTLSGYYLLVGALLFVLAGLPTIYAKRLCLMVALHHAFMAFKGMSEARRAWVTGNPWWDVAIHLAFVVAYLSYLNFVSRARTRSGTPALT